MTLLPLFIGLSVSLLSSFASNLWNHTNDLKEDIAQGKKTALTQNLVSRKTCIVLSLILYTISLIIVLYASIKFERSIYPFFLVWVIITWWYSDSIFIFKLFGFRLKTHYIGELITYGIAYPSYTISIWLVYSDLNASCIAIALAFSFLGISGVLLKDLKDISGDKKAGLRTFGVVFSPTKLIHYSCIFLFLYYLIILNSIALSIFGIGMLLVIFPFIWFMKNTFFYFHKKSWKLGAGDFRPIQTMMMSMYFSMIVMGIGAVV